MLTRTHDIENHSPEILHIPTSIQKDIEERGFHLYKWISPDEVKLSIEKDFLRVLKYMGAPLGVIAIILGFLSIIGFFITIFIGVFLIFLHLLFISIRRSILLSRSAFVVLTDSSISFGGKIVKLSDISSIKKDMQEVSSTFEEEIFETSGLEKSKQSLGKSVMDQLFGGYEFIFKNSGNRFSSRNDDSAKAVLLILALYTAYAAVMSVVYFVGVFFLWIFGNIITKINTWILIKRGHTVLRINELFGDLDRDSDNIKTKKYTLEHLLQEAQENNWKDGLLLEINQGIEEINNYAQDAILSVLELKNTIASSQYNDMFSFEIYNAWIKKQISKPLEDILKLLKQNKNILIESQNDIEKQISETQKTDFISVLALQKKRVENQLNIIENYIPLLENSITKLK